MLFAVEIEHFLAFEIAFEVVIYAYRSHSNRCSSVEKVARLECEILADVTYQAVDGINHV